MTSFTTDFAVASGQASVSPDGAHLVARNVDTGEQGVYSIKAVMPALDLSYLHSVAAPLEYTVFANGNLYGVDGDSIHRLNVSSPEALERVYTFPEGDATYTLIP